MGKQEIIRGVSMSDEIHENMQGGEMGPNQEAVEKHTQEGVVEYQDGVVCGDGRYDREDGGKIGEFGGDTSFAMVELAVANEQLSEEERKTYDVEAMVRKVVDAKINTNGKGFDGKFYYHTDDHAHHDDKFTGCGHVYGANSDPRYGLPDGWSERVVAELGRMKEDPDYTDKLVEQELTGAHGEAAVVVNNSKSTTVIHRLSINGQESSVFVKDAAIGEEYRKAVYATMSLNSDEVDTRERVKGSHDGVTSIRLALKKEVYVRDEQGKIEFAGWMGPKGLPIKDHPDTWEAKKIA